MGAGQPAEGSRGERVATDGALIVCGTEYTRRLRHRLRRERCGCRAACRGLPWERAGRSRWGTRLTGRLQGLAVRLATPKIIAARAPRGQAEQLATGIPVRGLAGCATQYEVILHLAHGLKKTSYWPFGAEQSANTSISGAAAPCPSSSTPSWVQCGVPGNRSENFLAEASFSPFPTRHIVYLLGSGSFGVGVGGTYVNTHTALQ